jgi:hypothetical protein
MCKYLMWNCGLPFEGNLRTQESHITTVQGFNVCEEETFRVNSLVHFGVTTMTCQGFLQCTLKLLNFLVALVGAFMILYSLWMLKEWHSDIAPPSSSDSPSPSPTTSLLDGNLARDGDFNILTSFSLQVTDAGMEQLGRPFLSYQKSTVALPDLPDPWSVSH